MNAPKNKMLTASRGIVPAREIIMESNNKYWFEFTEEYTEYRFEMGWLLVAWEFK